MANEVEATNMCRACLGTKPLTEFSPRQGMRLGVRNICKPCGSEQAMRWRDENADRARDAHLRRTFGITLAEYNDFLAEQGGVCAICGQPPTVKMGLESRRQGRLTQPMLVVDHDHATGKVRGLLCTHCNRGIGFLRDDPAIVRFALKYLEERA